MEQALNTLFVMTQNAYVHLDHETVKVEVGKETKLQVPLHHLGGITVFGNVMVSPGLLAKCAEDGRSVTWLSASGRFVGRLEGPVSGNVLLRKAQWQAVLDEALALPIARNMVAGKIQNARTSVLRSAREAEDSADQAALQGVGLDPQGGLLHVLRSGRPALALDTMEEFRALLADRLALTLINRKQIAREDFDFREGGSVLLNEKGRKAVVVAYQDRKKETVQHLILDQKVSLGLLPHVQARLLARVLRGDIEAYPPYLVR